MCVNKPLCPCTVDISRVNVAELVIHLNTPILFAKWTCVASGICLNAVNHSPQGTNLVYSAKKWEVGRF